jgi:CHAD domain-containing protein
MTYTIRQTLLDYFTGQCNVLTDNLFLVQTVYSEKAIHDLRVSIKRIRALFRLVERFNPKQFDSGENFRRFKQIFRPAGVLRDWQVQDKLLRHYAQSLNLKLNDYFEFLAKAQSKAQKQFQKSLLDFDTDKLTKNTKRLNESLARLADQHIRPKTVDLLNQQFALAQELSLNLEEEENLHEIRKITKAAFYKLNLVFKERANSPKPFQALKDLEEMIGDWHDRQVLLQRLRRFVKGEQGETLTEYQKLILQLESENLAVFKQIPALVKKELQVGRILKNAKVK